MIDQIPPIFTLPNIFTCQFIISIQQHVNNKLQFIQKFTEYNLNAHIQQRTISAHRLAYYTNLLSIQPIQQFLLNLYMFMTSKLYTIEQKYAVVNLVYKFLYLVSEIKMTKLELKEIIKKEVRKLADRYRSIKQSTESSNNMQDNNKHQNNNQPQQYTAPIFTFIQSQQLIIYLQSHIILFYELWQKILDQNEQFTITSKTFQPIQLVDHKQYQLQKGKKLQVSQILSLDLLKDYIGSQPPLEEKKDVKKK